MPEIEFSPELDHEAPMPSFRGAQDEGFDAVSLAPNQRVFLDSGRFDDDPLAGGAADATNEEEINTFSGLRLRFKSQN